MEALGVDDEEDGDEDGGSDVGEGDEEGADEGPPAFPALQARRDSVRGWLCVLYSFAAPNRHALPCNLQYAKHLSLSRTFTPFDILTSASTYPRPYCPSLITRFGKFTTRFYIE